jgi:hypothetical protein
MTTALDLTMAQAAWSADCKARQHNERVVDGFVAAAESHLPGERIVRPDAAYITVADLEDLGAWLWELRCPAVASPLAHGFEVWTLLASVPDWRGGPPVSVRVSAVVVAGEMDLANWIALVTS